MLRCVNSSPSPTGFDPIPPGFENDRHLNEIALDYQQLPSKYSDSPRSRVAVVALIIISTTLSILLLKGEFLPSSQSALQWLQSLNWTHIGVACATFAILSIGAGFIIYRIVGSGKHGKFSGDTHWEEAYYTRANSSRYSWRGYLDSSTFERDRTMRFYGNKESLDHYIITSTVILITPLHALASMAYHVARICIIPFYILGCILIEACRGENRPLFNGQRCFQWIDIPKQMWFSIKQFVKAPFYALAEIFALLYSWISPPNGCKLAYLIETRWNNKMQRHECFWSVAGPQSADWAFEGGGGPERLGRNGFIVVGCMSYFGKIEWREDGTRRETSASGRHAYRFTTASILRERHNERVRQIQTPVLRV